MSDLITIDASEPPEVGMVPDSLGWGDVEGYVRITKRPVLAPMQEGHGKFGGIFWNPAKAAVDATEDLGPGQQEALGQFREFLRQPASQ